MGTKSETKKNNKSIEDMFKELEEISKKLESKDETLEDSFNDYKMGMDLLKECREKLDYIEKEIKII